MYDATKLVPPEVSYKALVGARLSSVSSLSTFSEGGAIPLNAKLRAIPVDSDTLQIVRFRGDTYADAFVIFDDKNGNLVDVSGCTFIMSVSTGPRSGIGSEVQYAMDGTLDDPVNGLVSFTPSGSEADTVGFFFYEIEMRDSSNVVRTLIKDSYVYKQDLTD